MNENELYEWSLSILLLPISGISLIDLTLALQVLLRDVMSLFGVFLEDVGIVDVVLNGIGDWIVLVDGI